MLLRHDFGQTELRLFSATPRDFMEFRGTAPSGASQRNHLLMGFLPGEGKKQGLLVRSGNRQILGFAIYEKNAGALAVSEFTTNTQLPRAGSLLIAGLRQAARRNGVQTILLYQNDDPALNQLVMECGFNLMAYVDQDERRPGSPRTNVWRLAAQEEPGSPALEQRYIC